MANANSPAASKALRILILGGTGFIGPHFVEAALRRGHRISILSRTPRHNLPSEVEVLVGDRSGDLGVLGKRSWDIVFDLAAYGPGLVRTLGQALSGRCGLYVFVSSIAAYDFIAGPLPKETSPLAVFNGSEDPLTISTIGMHYGALKALAEMEAEKQFPSRTLIVRPGYIVGPGDFQEFFTFLAQRLSRGGEMLVAGDPSMPVQFVDVRDLAEFCLQQAEQNAAGVYNVMGPKRPTTYGEMIAAGSSTMANPATPTWVDSAWLTSQDHQPTWGKVLFWTDGPAGVAWTMRVNNERALRSGFTPRAMGETFSDTLAWSMRSTEKARDSVITSWRMGANGRPETVEELPWSTYLQRERLTLELWRNRANKG